MKPEFAAARVAQAKLFLDSDKNFQSSSFGTQVVVVGYSGKVTGIELAEVGQGQPQFKRTAQQGPQVINGVTVAEVGDPSVTLSAIFEGGKSISLSTLTQHPESQVGGDHALSMTGKQWNALVGKTLTCTRSDADNSRLIQRQQTVDGKTQMVERATRLYAFDVI